MNLIILGPQGSGKGTQAKALAKHFGLTHISTGELFRQEIASGSDLGKRIAEIINQGDLVSDEILFSVLEKAPLNSNKGFILDGTPRNLPQAKALDEVFSKVGLSIDKVIVINISREESVERMLNRAKIEHRSDDTLAVINKRLDLYQRETLPVIDFYRGKGLALEIDGMPDINTISKDIIARLESLGVK